MKCKLFLDVVLCLLVSVGLMAQDEKPRIAVIPLNHISVSKADADVVTGLFETAMVKTGVYSVIEQSQIRQILEAQEQSISDCTDEQCAIDFGKLLSAEQIVLGTLSSLGGKFILNAKIIDVTTGANIKADKETTTDLADMTDATELLAYKLAGLTYLKGSQEVVATELGEIFVETTPAGADIYVNGISKGRSPNLISKVPLGTVIVECRKDNLYGRQEVEVTAATRRIVLELTIAYGNMFVQSSVSDGVKVYLDGTELGDLGSGFFEKVPVGSYEIVLRGRGVYWEGEVAIRTGESARVEAYPREYGSISYGLPEGAHGEVEGRMFREAIRGQGVLEPVWIGEYRIRVSGENYEPYEETVEIERGKVHELAPELAFTREYLEGQAATERGRMYAGFEERLAELENRLRRTGYRIGQVDLIQVDRLRQDLADAKYDFEDLRNRNDTLLDEARRSTDMQARLVELAAQRGALVAEIAKMEKRRETLPLAGWISLGTWGGFGAFGTVSWLVGNSAYDRYMDTTTLDDVLLSKRRFQTWDALTYTSYGIGVAGAITFGVIRLFVPSRAKLERTQAQLAEIETEVDQIEQDLGVRE